ncbi:hybrid sensor histidine kinase/response regulator [Solitalea longa]|uniref:histidine kinase n=1 Tax=Solitalea longa TaxID=2079460 RepID=A0A2S5AA94_9SPHI|nr:hybrid sensor histidine kinase/response regulator transcription factor [Solitalea longa]POY39199.1 hybrid sensor histidine kinase/response regulator [Solitalea longa]
MNKKPGKIASKLFQRWNIVIFAFTLLTATNQVNAQADLKFNHINHEQGLTNSTIETIVQDAYGFIWIGTRDGLNRYDGYKMKTYRNTANDTTSLSDNYIKYLYLDKSKTLWIGTTNGLNQYNSLKNSFIIFKHEEGNATSIASNNITCMQEDRKGLLWIGTNGGGLSIYQPGTTNFKHFNYRKNKKGSINGNYINAIFRDPKGNMWVATDVGLNLYQESTNSFIQYLGNTPFHLKFIQNAPNAQLWIGTEDNGLLLFNPQTQAVKQFLHNDRLRNSLGSNMIKSLLATQTGHLWVGTINGGLNLLDPETENFKTFTNETGNNNSLSQRTVSALFEDKQGNLWIGTHRGGLNVYCPQAQKFNLYRQEINPYSLSYNNVKAFCEDHTGTIWIGTDGGGLNRFDRKTNRFYHYKYNPFSATSLGADAVLDVTEDSKNRLWIGTWAGGLSLMDNQNGSFKRFKHSPADNTSISSDYVQKIYEDRNGQLWVATYFGGLNKFDPQTQKFERFGYRTNSTLNLSGNNVVSINEDSDGNLWIGTDDGGLNCYNSAKRTIRHYFNNAAKKPDIRVLFNDSKNNFWVGQAGLYLYDKKHDRFTIYTNKAGLDHEFIKGIKEDDEGFLWISTNNGLTKFNPKTLEFKKFNNRDGLQDLEFEVNAALKTKDGSLFFGGVNGFNVFNPKTIQSNSFIAPVYITDFQIFNQPISVNDDHSPLQTDITQTDNIVLSYKQSSLSFGFAALNYVATDNNQYAYKLDGFEKNWHYVSADRRATYTNLSPGTYTFKVKAANNDGLWNPEARSIIIEIKPPFWLTWWFKLIIAVLLIAVVYAYNRNKQLLNHRKLEQKKKEEIHQMQLQFFTNISHEFRTPLTLILGPLEKLMNSTVDPLTGHAHQIIYRNAKRLMNLINELMDFRKAETGALSLKIMPGNMNVLLEEIAMEFEDWAEQKQLHFELINTPCTSDIYFDRQILEKILLNLINNSFKYTPEGGQVTVKLFFSLDDINPKFKNELNIKNDFKASNYFYVMVSDTGIGISEESLAHLFQRYFRINSSHLGSGIGLAFVKTLTLMHKGELYVYSERKKGTEIIIALPLGSENYQASELWLGKPDHIKIESLDNEYLYSDYGPEEITTLPAAEKSLASTGKKLLIVDDNPELRNFLSESLRDEFEITTAINGLDALSKIEMQLPDLIISDVMMPEMDGIKFCKRIKENAHTQHLPVILLTAKNGLEARIEGTESGADFYFSKPVSINLLSLTLRNIVAQNEKLKQLHIRSHQSELKEQCTNAIDKKFLDQLMTVIETHLIDPDLDVDFLCKELNMSRTKLYELLKRITGQSIVEFIRTIRLNKAAEIMINEDAALAEVMYRVGIQTQSYFTKAFKKEFGKTPSQFLQELTTHKQE